MPCSVSSDHAFSFEAIAASVRTTATTAVSSARITATTAVSSARITAATAISPAGTTAQAIKCATRA